MPIILVPERLVMCYRFIVVLVCCLTMTAPSATVWSVRAGRVYDTEHARVLTDQWIEIEGARIRAMRPTRATDGTPTLDWSSYAVMPGWVFTSSRMSSPSEPGVSL